MPGKLAEEGRDLALLPDHVAATFVGQRHPQRVLEGQVTPTWPIDVVTAGTTMPRWFKPLIAHLNALLALSILAKTWPMG